LHQIRRALKDNFPVAAQGETLTWQPGADTWVDTAAFRDTAGRAMQGNGALTDGQVAELEDGLALVRGPVLEGCALADSAEFDDWLAMERQHWQNTILDALARLSAGLTARDQWADVI